jgi:hypothetical protein
VTAADVKTEFLHAWNGYKQYAWGHDEMLPVSKGPKDWHADTLYMTPVDALDTMLIMGLKDEADKTREFIGVEADEQSRSAARSTRITNTSSSARSCSAIATAATCGATASATSTRISPTRHRRGCGTALPT